MSDFPFTFIPPMLGVLGREPPTSPTYLYEIKWDGYRCLAWVDRGSGEVRLRSRHNKAFNHLFPELLGIGHEVKAERAILDGEIVAFVEGRPSFSHLQRRAGWPEPADTGGEKARLVYVVFDLLFLNGRRLMPMPLEERRAALVEILKPRQFCLLSEILPVRGRPVLEAAAKLGLEGVMAKERHSPYLPGKRSRAWLKFKPEKVLVAWIGGYLTRPGSGRLASLLLGLPAGERQVGNGGSPEKERLVYVGNVGTGFTGEEARELLARLEPWRRPHSPFVMPLAFPGFEVVWVEPSWRGRVAYQEWTAGGRLRHPVWRGLI